MLAVCEILWDVDWCVDKIIYFKEIILFYYKVVS